MERVLALAVQKKSGGNAWVIDNFLPLEKGRRIEAGDHLFLTTFNFSPQQDAHEEVRVTVRVTYVIYQHLRDTAVVELSDEGFSTFIQIMGIYGVTESGDRYMELT